jgi:chemotaxis family two-component system response regulator Rcp1
MHNSDKSPRRLLVVEDNPTDALLLRRALTEHGVDYEMVVVGDGEEAIEYLEKCKGAKPELIIVDLNLPKEDGIEVLKVYRGSPSFIETQMVILTSSDSPSERQRAEIIGVDAYLRKPIELDAFLALGGTLKKLLELPPKVQNVI